MVHVERYQPENVRNGRSRGPSPNGHNTPDTSDDDSTKNAKGNKSNKGKSEYEEKIRVGKDYQTVCPDYIPPHERKLEALSDRALLVWSPTKDIPDNKLEDYITVAKDKYGYNGEQALGMLFWHKHDLERAVMDLANFTPFPDEWTEEDKVLFEQAFHFHGKSFHRIRQMLPDKNIASLVKYYYSWKKSRQRTSVMDRQEKLKAKEGSENGSENGSNEDSDSEDKKWPLHRGIRRASRSPPPRTSDESSNSVSSSAMKQASPNQTSGTNNPTSNQPNTVTSQTTKDATTNSNHDHSTNPLNINGSQISSASSSSIQNANANANANGNAQCNNDNSAIINADSAGNANGANKIKECFGCGVPCNQTNTSPHGALCNSCYHHWSRTGSLRPTSGPTLGKRARRNGVERHKSKLPRGMYINHDDIVTLAKQSNEPNNRGDDLLTSMDREISSLLTQIQNNKQIVGRLAIQTQNEAIQALRLNDLGNNRISSRWSGDETQLAVKAFGVYGKDFQSIADIIGTKNEQHVRQFYTNYRKKYGLDAILSELEAKQQQQQQQEQKKIEIPCSSNAISPKCEPNQNNKIALKIDLVDDISNNKEDEDMDDVMVVESTPSPTPQKLKSVEPMDSISITAISSSSNNVSSHQPQEPVPEVTISPAPSSLSSLSTSGQTSISVNSSVSTSIIAMVEQAKAAAV